MVSTTFHIRLVQGLEEFRRINGALLVHKDWKFVQEVVASWITLHNRKPVMNEFLKNPMIGKLEICNILEEICDDLAKWNVIP